MDRTCNLCNKQLILTEGFHKNGKNTDGTQRYRYECKSCYNAKKRISYEEKRDVYKEILLEQFKVLSCSICGYDKCFAALDLHHRNPKDKDYTISKMKTYSDKLIKIEVQKCDLICANCHREIHSRDSEAAGVAGDVS